MNIHHPHWFTVLSLFLSLLLTGCLSGGDGSDEESEESTTVSVAKIVLLTDVTTQLADNQSTITLTAVAKEADNLPLSGINITFYTDSDTALFSAQRGETDEQGRFITTLTNSVAENISVYARAEGQESEPLSLNFIDDTLDPRVKTVALTLLNNRQPADGQAQITLNLAARDANGAIIPNVAVSLASSSNTAQFAALNGTTGANGTFTTTVTNQVAETFTVTPIAGGRRGDPVTVTFVLPSDQLSLSATAVTLPVQATTTVMFTLYQGNEATNRTPLANASFTASVSGHAQITNLPAQTNTQGQASFNVSNPQAENVVVTVRSGELQQQLTLYFGAYLKLTPDIAHIKENITLTALLKDAQNQPIVGLPLQFSFIDQNNETLSPASATTNEAGTAEVTVEDLQRDGGEAIVKVTSGQLSDQSSVRFQAVIGEDYQLTVSAEETVLAEGDSTTITAQVTDDQGLPVSNEPIKFYVQTGQGYATIQQSAQTTDEQGEAQAEITGRGSPWIGIKAGNSVQTVKLYFGAITQLSPTDSAGTADGETPTPLTATVTGLYGHSIAGATVTLRVTEGQAFLPNAKIVTDENGQVHFNVLSNDDGEVTVSAQAGNSQPATAKVIFYPVGINPQVDKVSLVVSNSPQPADGVTPITLTVIAQDAEQSPLANIPISFTSDSPNAFFSAVRGVTEENGRFSTTVTNQVVESFNVTAVAGGMRSEPQTLNFTNLTVGNIQLAASENVLQAGETTTVTATITGVAEATPLGGTPLQVAASGQARLRNVPEATDVNGQAQFQVSSSQKETVLVTVSSGSRRQTLTLYFGASLTMTRTEIVASRETRVSTLLKDANNAPIAAETIHFRFTEQNPYTLSAATGTTDNSGYASVEVIDVNQQGGEAVVVAHRGQLKTQANVKFLAGFADNYQLRAETNVTVLPVGEAVTMTAKINDDRGNPVVGQPLNFSVIRPGGGIAQATVTNPQATTDEQGEAQTQILGKRAENLQAIVQAGEAQQSMSLYVGGQLRLMPKETRLTVNNPTPTPFTATLTDYLDQPISGAMVKFSADGGAQLQPNNVLTDENGQAQVSVTNQQVETVTLTAQSGLLPLQTALIRFQPAPPQIGFLNLSSDKNQLALNDAATITATVYDTNSQPMSGEMVQFQVDGVGTISNSALTDENGIATATFHSRTVAGLTTVTASSGELNEQITLSVQAGEAGIIELVSIEPQVIGIVGSGVNQTTRLEFLVKDNLGNPLEKQLVKFSLGNTTLGGGEALVITEALTNNGTVTTSLKSGAVAGNIDVIATVADSQISTVARVTIVGGMPDANHFSLAVEHLNIAGGVTFGLQNTVTAYVGDRFGNVVPDGTAVSFITEGGTIGKSIGSDAFTTTTEFGQASAVLQSAAPSTPNLGGVSFMSAGGYACREPYNYVSGGSRHLCGNPGLVTIVAYTTGSESFVDSNGNGLYDEGEPFDDLSEPYLNSNENWRFDPGELYIDVNGNGQFDQGDGKFQSNTTIWKNIVVLFSANTAVPTVEPSNFNIANGSSQTFVVRNVGDIYGNALVAGSRLTVTANGGVLGGTTAYTFDDTNGRGIEELTFTLASLPPEESEDEEGNVKLSYPAPQSVTITIQVESPQTEDQATGSNGTITPVVISGQINSR